MQTKLLYEDNDILVIQKPAGLAVQSARIGQPDVVSELKNYLAAGSLQGKNVPGIQPYLGIVHRLDQPVEGLLVYGKNQKAAAELGRQLQGADFTKEYLAVVCGKPQEERQELVDYLIKENGRAVVSTQKEAKKAVLQYEVAAVKTIESEEVSLLRVRLATGRFHQIRAQLSHAGFPILGDSKYGNEKSSNMAKRLGIRNTGLCAVRLVFLHPANKKKMEYTVSPTNPAFALFEE